MIVPIRAFGKENHRSLSSLPQKPSIEISSEKRMMMTWWAQEIHLWQIPESGMSLHVSGRPVKECERLLAKIKIQVRQNINTTFRMSANVASREKTL